MASRADELIACLGLRPHPEGGHYAEVFRSAARVVADGGRGLRPALTAIYFLLRHGETSRWHRVCSDEVWCHLEGAPLELHDLDAATLELVSLPLGPAARGRRPLHTVAAGRWQAARSLGGYSLLSCHVAPGFDFADFALLATDAPLRAAIAGRHPHLAGY